MTRHISNKEFGGPFGALAIIIFSHFLVYYLWASLAYHQGGLFLPHSIGDIFPFFARFFQQIAHGAFPTFHAVLIYLGFVGLQLLLACCMPGVWIKGLPVPSEKNIQHKYLCNGAASWYATLILVGILNYTGLFKLSSLADNLGPLITVAIIVSNLLSVAAYAITRFRKKQLTPSGNILYDFFMGVVLNPRVGMIDLKFFAEIRVAWILLFLLTLSAAAKQFEMLGTLSWAMIFMVVAHGLYTNACMKGEECIPTTWDIFHEKWGWMLIFWNFAGVPFVYCFQSYYILENNPQYPWYYTLALFIVLFVAYYIWDTSQSQKNRFRMQLRGTFVPRKTFPQLPWGTLQNPRYLKTTNGDALLIDGWWRYARKIHYFADTLMALTWALSCGFTGIFPYLYPAFFITMILHRYCRDSARCTKKYGEDWDRYCKIVRYKFIPFIF